MTTPVADGGALEIKRLIKAPRERVFDAWTTPSDIVKWFGSTECRTLSAHVDLRVGGEYRFRVDSGACGGAMEVSGVYREIERPSRLVYTWSLSNPKLGVSETLVTVDFANVNGATEVRLRHERLPTAEQRDSHNHGWIGSFDKLEKLFS